MKTEKPLSEKMFKVYIEGENFVTSFKGKDVKKAVEKLKEVKLCPTKELWLEEINKIFGDLK